MHEKYDYPEKDTRSPQEIAAEFMKGVNTNPLLQPKKGK